MPTFDVPVELNKNPITGLVLEPTTTDLTSPVEGLVEVRTDTHHVYVYLNGAWVRLDNPALILTADLADNSVTSAKIVDGTITDVDVATANKDGLATAPSLRTLGTGAQQAAVGAHIHGGLVFFLDPTDASDIATYKRLQTSPSAAVESTLVTAVSGTGDVLVAAFATDPGVPGAVDFPAGTGTRNIYALVSTGVARFHMQVYVRSAAGNEVLLRDEFSASFSNTVVQLQSWAMATANVGSLSATDRLVVKLYAQRVSGPTNFNVTTLYEGTAHTSSIQTSISAGAPVGAAGGDLTGTYPNPTIRAGLIPAMPYAGTSPALSAGIWTTLTHSIGSTARDVSFTETVSGEARLVDWRVKTAAATTSIEIRSGVDRAAGYYNVYVEA